MRTTQFPDPATHDMDGPACPTYGWPNFIHHGRARSVYYPPHWGPLSIKCAFRGQEVYETGRSRYSVDPHAYLILNHGQRYSSLIDSREETESFVVFFRPGFAEQTLASLVTPADRLLDEPGLSSRQPVAFFEGLHPCDEFLSPLLLRLRTASRQPTATYGWFEEQFHFLLEQMLVAHRGVCAQIERVDAQRPSTRIELYRRLCLARDFMEARYADPIRLTDISREACLSPHHFLRLFKQAFQETPHQYLTRKRLAIARRLLTVTELPIRSVCASVGFESFGSFSTLFHRRFGSSPSAFRRRMAPGDRFSLDDEAFGNLWL